MKNIDFSNINVNTKIDVVMNDNLEAESTCSKDQQYDMSFYDNCNNFSQEQIGLDSCGCE